MNVAGTPSVTVGNSSANPVFVLDTAEHARQPFQQTSFLFFNDGDYASTIAGYAVPAGKRLVIEHIDVAFGIPNGEIPARL